MKTKAGGEPGAGALAGLNVVDLSRVLAGPLCTQILSDHGAEVIKVEPPAGDETRTWGPPFSQGTGAYFVGINRNKRDIVLDLTRPEARDVLLRLLEDADVLVENFKTGTMERWGLGYEDVLKEKFPQLIYARISGFGDDGPLGGMPGYDAVLQAMCGVMSVNGDPATGATRMGISIVDITAGLNAVIGIMLAVAERNRSSLGQRVESTLYDSALSLLHPHAANWFMDGREPQLVGSGHLTIFPYDKFTAAGGKDIFVGIGNDRQFRKFCDHLGLDGVADDDRFRTNGDRTVNRDKLRPLLEQAIGARQADELCDELLALGVPAGPVRSVPEAFSHAHTDHRNMRVRLGPDEQSTGVPVKLSRTPGAAKTPAPAWGQDSRAILGDAGYSEDEIARLLADGAVSESR
ncbi:CaiB/BaiF CoA transferase family protein [Sphingopyxis granuli]|uniref:CoA-transferase-like protein n=2 Tax=Sphingopyxis TaxID=165697 RepID=D9PTN2_SPHMC|nr:CaiB/BaiF CoA-transferase family protein [Sphingopyxis granuli]ADK93992.1 CoA-transferase-like protein [Sphingopyxis macrogoltabida]AMG75142.1 CoA-transferase-like protein [Sphingopyxis granuli]